MVNQKSVMAVIRAARPSFRNNHDKIAFAVHASFLAAGYVLTATGPPAFSENALSSASTDEVGTDQWNEQDDEYAFVYTSPEKGKKVLVKCLAMNDKLLVDALAEGASEPVHLEINVGDYVEENGGTNYSAQFKKLAELVKRLDTEVLSKLDGSPQPGLSISGSR
ncbi:putative proteasome inhibitor [Morella rubra]|uniref:Putative proteasome inhibitor n=1 Tax=Morella rubra TaxID=262757 RepID=A0A6A1WKH4_9ROSI|nr:putative proteasome inhibitor [Morella rubra]